MKIVLHPDNSNLSSNHWIDINTNCVDNSGLELYLFADKHKPNQHRTSKTQLSLSNEIVYRQLYVVRSFENLYNDNEQWFC
jgi:hypothetical protein